MTEKEPYPSDKTPVFGLDELEPATNHFPSESPSQPQASGHMPPADSTDTVNVHPVIVLYDQLSQVRLSTDTFPVEIGNGRRFDMALKGPGPEGLYARIENDKGVLTIERSQPSIFMAAANVEVSRYVLTGPVSFQLGDHMIDFAFTDKLVRATPRKRRRWILPVALIVLIVGAFLLRLLLKADEAESRVSVVTQNQSISEPASVQIAPAPADVSTSPGFDQATEASASDETDSEVAVNGSNNTALEPLTPPPAISAFFTTSSLLPLPSARTPENLSKPPAQETEISSTQARTPLRTQARAQADAPAPVADDSASLIARYRQGDPLPSASGPPELKNAVSAIRAYYNSDTLDQQLVAWEALTVAERSLGLTETSQPGEEIRTALRESLLQAARQKEQEKEMRQAYELFYQAHSVGQHSEQGQQLMLTLDTEAAQLYRFGYRLKYSNPVTAKQYWEQVINQVPPQSPWHRKAALALGDTKRIKG
jgi:hypothetical protein